MCVLFAASFGLFFYPGSILHIRNIYFCISLAAFVIFSPEGFYLSPIWSDHISARFLKHLSHIPLSLSLESFIHCGQFRQ